MTCSPTLGTFAIGSRLVLYLKLLPCPSAENALYRVLALLALEQRLLVLSQLFRLQLGLYAAHITLNPPVVLSRSEAKAALRLPRPDHKGVHRVLVALRTVRHDFFWYFHNIT